jgi:protein-tyrosine phosphatase
MERWAIHKLRSRGFESDNHVVLFPNMIVANGFRLTTSFAAVHNITHVINCASDEFSPLWFRKVNPDKYVSIGALDSPDSDIIEWYPKFEETMNKFLADPSVKAIFVHCQCGINRAPIMASIYCAKKLKKPFMEVANAVAGVRPCVFTNMVYVRQANQYITNLLNNEQSNME